MLQKLHVQSDADVLSNKGATVFGCSVTHQPKVFPTDFRSRR